MIFGDKSTTDRYAGNPAIQIHGPGYSKILIGDDEIERWPKYIDLMVSSIADNGGRSCINASTIVVSKHGAEIADALAQKLGPIVPLSATDENARLSGFANAKMAEYIDGAIEQDLKAPGASDVTAKYRQGSRKVEFEGGVYLRPTIVFCDPSRIRWRTGNFCVRTPAWLWKCRKAKCWKQTRPIISCDCDHQ